MHDTVISFLTKFVNYAGIINDKNFLPITHLRFGRIMTDTSSGFHTLGRLKCSGQVAVKAMPSSCEDLWRKGHTLSGFYSVLGAKQIENVHCDFTKLPKQPSINTILTYPIKYFAHQQININGLIKIIFK